MKIYGGSLTQHEIVEGNANYSHPYVILDAGE